MSQQHHNEYSNNNNHSTDLFDLLQFPDDTPVPVLSAEQVQHELDFFASGQFTFDIPPPSFDANPSTLIDPSSLDNQSSFSADSANALDAPAAPAKKSRAAPKTRKPRKQKQKEPSTSTQTTANDAGSNKPPSVILPRWDNSTQVVPHLAVPFLQSSAQQQQPPLQQQQQPQQPTILIAPPGYAYHNLAQPYAITIPSATNPALAVPIPPSQPVVAPSAPLSNPIVKASIDTPSVRVVPTLPADSTSSKRKAAEPTEDDDKRKRSTAASARFRLRKKAQQEAIESTAREMTIKCDLLTSRVKELETEVNWLRGLLISRDGAEKVAMLSEMWGKNKGLVLGMSGMPMALNASSENSDLTFTNGNENSSAKGIGGLVI